MLNTKPTDGLTEETKITAKEAYDAMLYLLRFYYDAGIIDLTDILSPGEYMEDGSPADPAVWHNWIDAILKAKKEGPPIKKWK